jgi:hypothetical protein
MDKLVPTTSQNVTIRSVLSTQTKEENWTISTQTLLKYIADLDRRWQPDRIGNISENIDMTIDTTIRLALTCAFRLTNTLVSDSSPRLIDFYSAAAIRIAVGTNDKVNLTSWSDLSNIHMKYEVLAWLYTLESRIDTDMFKKRTSGTMTEPTYILTAKDTTVALKYLPYSENLTESRIRWAIFWFQVHGFPIEVDGILAVAYFGAEKYGTIPECIIGVKDTTYRVNLFVNVCKSMAQNGFYYRTLWVDKMQQIVKTISQCDAMKETLPITITTLNDLVNVHTYPIFEYYRKCVWIGKKYSKFTDVAAYALTSRNVYYILPCTMDVNVQYGIDTFTDMSVTIGTNRDDVIEFELFNEKYAFTISQYSYSLPARVFQKEYIANYYIACLILGRNPIKHWVQSHFVMYEPAFVKHSTIRDVSKLKMIDTLYNTPTSFMLYDYQLAPTKHYMDQLQTFDGRYNRKVTPLRSWFFSVDKTDYGIDGTVQDLLLDDLVMNALNKNTTVIKQTSSLETIEETGSLETIEPQKSGKVRKRDKDSTSNKKKATDVSIIRLEQGTSNYIVVPQWSLYVIWDMITSKPPSRIKTIFKCVNVITRDLKLRMSDVFIYTLLAYVFAIDVGGAPGKEDVIGILSLDDIKEIKSDLIMRRINHEYIFYYKNAPTNYVAHKIHRDFHSAPDSLMIDGGLLWSHYIYATKNGLNVDSVNELLSGIHDDPIYMSYNYFKMLNTDNISLLVSLSDNKYPKLSGTEMNKYINAIKTWNPEHIHSMDIAAPISQVISSDTIDTAGLNKTTEIIAKALMAQQNETQRIKAENKQLEETLKTQTDTEVAEAKKQLYQEFNKTIKTNVIDKLELLTKEQNGLVIRMDNLEAKLATLTQDSTTVARNAVNSILEGKQFVSENDIGDRIRKAIENMKQSGTGNPVTDWVSSLVYGKDEITKFLERPDHSVRQRGLFYVPFVTMCRIIYYTYVDPNTVADKIVSIWAYNGDVKTEFEQIIRDFALVYDEWDADCQNIDMGLPWIMKCWLRPNLSGYGINQSSFISQISAGIERYRMELLPYSSWYLSEFGIHP